MRRRSFINIIGKNEDNILTDMLQAEEPTETMTVEKDAKE
jgi:hypothetical protein